MKLHRYMCKGWVVDQGALSKPKCEDDVRDQLRAYIHNVLTKVHYINTNDIKSNGIYGNILKPWNAMAIKHMCIQCVPGALFPSLSCLGTRLGHHKIQ